MNKVSILLITVVTFGTGIFLPVSISHASILSFEHKTDETVQIVLDSEDETVNAYEGKVIYDPETIHIETIQDGNSIISVWIEKPSVKTPGEIVFSGITPGGYKGNAGQLFSLTYTYLADKESTLQFDSSRVLLHDGQGTESHLTTKSYSVATNQEKVSQPSELIQDLYPPENFQILLSQNPNIFDNQWFISFATQDKGSGVSYYEVREKKPGVILNFFTPHVFTQEKSPYLLKDQTLTSLVTVRAFDYAGNMREVQIQPQNSLPFYQSDLFIIFTFVATTLSGTMVLIIRKKTKLPHVS